MSMIPRTWPPSATRLGPSAPRWSPREAPTSHANLKSDLLQGESEDLSKSALGRSRQVLLCLEKLLCLRAGGLFLLLASISASCHIYGSIKGCVFQAWSLELGAETHSCSRLRHQARSLSPFISIEPSYSFHKYKYGPLWSDQMLQML